MVWWRAGERGTFLKSWGLGLRARYGYVCQEGFYPDKPGYICQDQVTVLERFEDNPDQFFCGVFDGHGKIGCGEVVSQKTQKYLPNKILEMRASGRCRPPATAGTSRNRVEKEFQATPAV